jgi:hypothetical protein
MKLKGQSPLTIFRIVALGLAGWSAIILMSLSLGYETIYLHYPKAPDPATLRIYPYAFKNTVRYLTKEQIETMHRLDWTLIVLAVFIGINLLINQKWPLPSEKKSGLIANEYDPILRGERLRFLKWAAVFFMLVGAFFLFCYRS